eukprot:COSAG05_NODE_5413_length_1181_cov_1.868762_1_plen_221_part_10
MEHTSYDKMQPAVGLQLEGDGATGGSSAGPSSTQLSPSNRQPSSNNNVTVLEGAVAASPQMAAALSEKERFMEELYTSAVGSAAQPPGLPPSVAPSGQARRGSASDPRAARHIDQVEALRNRLLVGSISGDASVRHAAVAERQKAADAEAHASCEVGNEDAAASDAGDTDVSVALSESDKRHLEQVETLRKRLMNGSIAADDSIRHAAVAERNGQCSSTLG